MSTYKNLNFRDIISSLISTFGTGFFLYIIGAIGMPGFDVFSANWVTLFSAALGAGIISITKKYFTDDTHKLFGVVKV